MQEGVLGQPAAAVEKPEAGFPTAAWKTLGAFPTGCPAPAASLP